eukprot:TRINITY_DN14191_c0_g1_i1.p1 TRINITY_DN14191_c0_g1~~TRINITY_DN14191_c0_g1_i1.p1  ORF type:complete len:366 (-),score=14.72 TRINITY_DN14191_c0_g1_i1:9-1106(-)
MQKIIVICVLLAVVSQVTSDSLCQQLFAAGSQKEFMKRFAQFSFTMFQATDSIAPYFDGRALDRSGNHVTNYFKNDTALKSLVESHSQYYGQLLNCSDPDFASGYNGPSMAEAHANLFIGRSVFERYQQLSLQYLSIVSLTSLTFRQSMKGSQLFEEHRLANTSNQICNEADCQDNVFAIDDHGEMSSYFLNMEQGQDVTIVNQFFAKGYDLAVSGSDLCTALSPIVHVDISANLTTSILANLTGGDYYLGTWPRASCNLDSHSRGKILAQIHIPSIEPPFEAPIEAPIEPPVGSAPIDAPVQSPVQVPSNPSEPVSEPHSDKEPTDLLPVVIVLSIVLGVLVIVAGVLLYKLKHKQPQYYDTIQ